MRKFTLLDWSNLAFTGLMVAGVFLPWTHGFAYSAKFIPPGYNPVHNGLDDLHAGAGYALLAGSIVGILLWLVSRRFPGLVGLIASALKLVIGSVMIYMVKIYYNDFDYFFGFTVLPGFWVALVGLILWLGLAVVELVRDFRQVSRAKTLAN